MIYWERNNRCKVSLWIMTSCVANEVIDVACHFQKKTESRGLILAPARGWFRQSLCSVLPGSVFNGVRLCAKRQPQKLRKCCGWFSTQPRSC